jgi:hypothetical protein
MARLTGQGAAVGVFVAVGNFLIFQHFMGASVADVKHTTSPLDTDVERMEREALYYSIGFTLLASAIVSNWDTFLVGGSAVVLMDFAYKHANAYNPQTKSMSPGGSASNAAISGGQGQAGLPDYTNADEGAYS